MIHTEVHESLDALEQRELEEAIALSLGTSSVASDDSPRPNEAPRKAPPPSLSQHRTFLEVPVLERPAMLPFGVAPRDPVPLPPAQPPTSEQRILARQRLAALPTLFPPTGAAWMQSQLAQAKAPPPVLPPPSGRPDRERWYFFPSMSVGDSFPIRRRPPFPPVPERSDGESDNNSDHDAFSDASTAPSLSENHSDWE